MGYERREVVGDCRRAARSGVGRAELGGEREMRPWGMAGGNRHRVRLCEGANRVVKSTCVLCCDE